MKNNELTPIYKEYTQGQIMLLPTDLEEQIPPKHMVRVVSSAIDKMDLSPLYARYKGGGTSSYHPRMMLKVLVYAYTQQIYSSRKIAKALRENIYFMWLSGLQRPDFRTINRFRGEVVKEVIEDIFTAVLGLLIEEGYIKLENYFLDGTKLEANANKYTWVWAKNTRRYKEQLREKVNELLLVIEQANEEENAEYGERDLEELGRNETWDAERLEQKIEQLNQRLKALANKDEDSLAEGQVGEQPSAVDTVGKSQAKTENQGKVAKKAKTKRGKRGKSKLQKAQEALRKLEKEYLPREKKYEEQEQKLAGRNSYSKTDEDATFMRMK